MASNLKTFALTFCVMTAGLLQLGTSQLVDGGAYRIENKESGKHMTSQPLSSDLDGLTYVITADWTFAMEQTWGVEFDGSYRTLTPGRNRQNNVSVETLPGSSFITSVLYSLENIEANEYRIKTKRTGECLYEQEAVIHLGTCENANNFLWKFYRTG